MNEGFDEIRAMSVFEVMEGAGNIAWQNYLDACVHIYSHSVTPFLTQDLTRLENSDTIGSIKE